MCAHSAEAGSLARYRSTPINAPLAGPKAKAGRPSPQPHLVLAHLLGERLLVLVDGTLQPPHAAVLAQPDLVRHLVDEPKIVRHEHHASAKSLDGGGEAVDCVHVEVVGRLVQQQQLGLVHDRDCNRHAHLPAARQRVDKRGAVLLRELDLVERRLDEGVVDVAAAGELGRRLVLEESAHVDAVVAQHLVPDVPGAQLLREAVDVLGGKSVEQGRLAGPVLAD
mmetsp:Transcript_23864/g.70987  ORF Transcript_23864/g.70987 Transcript_23864/m.70987 type:complete len:223 (-) Transcript_23864:142-810(-)